MYGLFIDLLIVCHAKRFYALPVNLNEMDDIYAAIIKQPALEKNVIKNKKWNTRSLEKPRISMMAEIIPTVTLSKEK